MPCLRGLRETGLAHPPIAEPTDTAKATITSLLNDPVYPIPNSNFHQEQTLARARYAAGRVVQGRLYMRGAARRDPTPSLTSTTKHHAYALSSRASGIMNVVVRAIPSFAQFDLSLGFSGE
jgi:hypothetical protein